MVILYILLILLVTTRIFGEIARRLNVAALAGEIIGGIFLGLIFNQFSDTFTVLSDLENNEVFHAITELGMFFLMLYAGIELNFKSLKKASSVAVWVAVGGMVLPLLLGVTVGWYYFPESELRSAQIFFLGVALAITAVPVAIKVLMDLKLLDSKLGRTIVSAAVIDDVISLILLAALTSFLQTGELPGFEGILIITGKIIVFFVATIAIGIYLLPRVAKFVDNKINIDESETSFLILMALLFSVLAELLGMHFILGAFIAGLFFSKRNMRKSVFKDVERKIKAITSGFLAPIFFASIGLHIDLQAIMEVPVFVIVLIIVATVSKVLGAAIPARISGFSKLDSLSIGSAMNARGAVELIIADVALRSGLFKLPEDSIIIQNLFSAVVLMTIVTTLITPFVLRAIANRRDSSN
ncbi:MAG: cation:proton antiporter [Crocinitomicaceae bacterium]|nr:cation:proton antiporter [Crocinitomicaceae bacterium]